jgi:tRNA(fMet)-specific endonuclease VapC
LGVKVCLDTSAWAWFRKNEPEIVSRIQRATAVYVPTAAIGELEAAFLRGNRARENQLVLDDFLDEALVHEVVIDRKIARRYGALFARLRELGTPIPINDVWIAAASIEVGARLLTFDRDFECVPGLDVAVLTPPRPRPGRS